MVNKSKLLNNDNLVNCLSSALSRGESGLKNIPGLIKRVIEEKAWKERYIEMTNELVKFNNFIDFISCSTPKGLGTTFEMIWRICLNETEVLVLLDEVISKNRGNPSGNNQYIKLGNIDNVNNSKPVNGNSRQYALRRLRKSRPDLLKLVIENNLSINQAMIKAGFRKKQINNVINQQNVAEILKKNFSQENLSEIIRSLI